MTPRRRSRSIVISVRSSCLASLCLALAAGLAGLVAATPAAAQRAAPASSMSQGAVIPGAGQPIPWAPVADTTSALGRAVAGLHWRSIGPAVTGGRIPAIAVDPRNADVFYVGTASGGVWKTENDGMSWAHVFAREGTASIGAVAVAPSNPDVVWVGTGEPQNRQSSPFGAGVYKSEDGGRHWTFMGLAETRHIGRIVIDPTDPDRVYVAAVGHLFGPNPQRGVFRTTDGGKTWRKVLYIDENTGAIDLVMDPEHPRTLLAAMYQRRRRAWGFSADGAGSGIYRTRDGGDTWQELTSGLPAGYKGRIGLDIYRKDPHIVYALVQSRGNGRGLYRSTDEGDTWKKMSDRDPRPMYFSLVRIDPDNVNRIYVGGVQLSVSDDGGHTWWKGDGSPTIHVDHHALWIDPRDPDHILMGQDGGLAESRDGSKTWRMIDNLPIGQFYDIGVDMRDPYYVCGGLQDNSSWCGPSRTLSNYGIRNSDWYDVSGGDGFVNRPDPADSNIVYTEWQEGNVSRYNVATGEAQQIKPLNRAAADVDSLRYRWNWNTPIELSPEAPNTVYLGANVLLRSTDRGVSWQAISPDLTRHIDRDTLKIMGRLTTDSTLSRNDGVAFFGTITTIAPSPLDPNVIYVGTDDGNLQVTQDGGKTWTNVASRVPGVRNGTLVSHISASYAVRGRVYASFDAHYDDDYLPYVYVSEDYGRHWRKITDGLPAWPVNTVIEHPKQPDLLFVGNDVGVYVSTDRGGHWTRLGGENFPTVPVDALVVQPRANDLVAGTHGLSIWILRDLEPLERVAASGGAVLDSSVDLFPVRRATEWRLQGTWPFHGDQYAAKNPAYGALIRYWVSPAAPGAAAPSSKKTSRRASATRARATKAVPHRSGARVTPGAAKGGPKAAMDSATITILGPGGDTIRVLKGPMTPGLHRVVWDLRLKPPYRVPPGASRGFFGAPRGPQVLPGTYTASLEAAGVTRTVPVEVRMDPRLHPSSATLAARQKALLDLYALAGPVHEAQQAVNRLGRQLGEVKTLLKKTKHAPSDLAAEADSLATRVDTLRSRLGRAGRLSRVAAGVERSTAAPTADQLWEIDHAWQQVPAQIAQVNTIITDRMPALNRRLNAAGIRPSPGEPIAVPRRPGG